MDKTWAETYTALAQCATSAVLTALSIADSLAATRSIIAMSRTVTERSKSLSGKQIPCALEPKRLQRTTASVPSGRPPIQQTMQLRKCSQASSRAICRWPCLLIWGAVRKPRSFTNDSTNWTAHSAHWDLCRPYASMVSLSLASATPPDTPDLLCRRYSSMVWRSLSSAVLPDKHEQA